MPITVLESVKNIERQYRTGEEPVMVMCSDMNSYICKYMRSSAAAYKLACELIGSTMATAWQLRTPETAFVYIKPGHWIGQFTQRNLSVPTFGCKRITGVVDVTPSIYADIIPTTETLLQLIKIALFDFWIANEDRNANNANLLYNIEHKELVSIDYGCILNTASFDYPLSQLTTTDTILYSDLFQYLKGNRSNAQILRFARGLETTYKNCIKQCEKQIKTIVSALPEKWQISQHIVEEKLQQLFETQWTAGVWNNFMECLNENLQK